MRTPPLPKIGLKSAKVRLAARRAKQADKAANETLRPVLKRDALAGVSFNKVLGPPRKAFANGGMSEDDLDQVVTEARRAIHSRARRKVRK